MKTNFDKQFKKLEKENKALFDESKKHLEYWAYSRDALNKSIQANKESVQYIFEFSKVCLAFKDFMQKYAKSYEYYKIPYEPMLKQINIDLQYVINERERRLKLKEVEKK